MRKSINITLVLATLLGLTVLSVAPVAAEDTTTTSTSDSTSTSTTTASGDATVTTSETGTMPTGSDEQAHAETEVARFREEASQELQTERKNTKEHTVAERQKACDAHQAELDTRIGDYAREAQNNLNVFSSIFTKVQTFYATKKLNVATYAALSATVTTQQAAAQSAVDALSLLSGTKIDCTQPDPAQQLASLKTAVDTARSALQAYRTAIKNLIVAIEGASSAQTDTSTQTTTSTGGNQ